MSDAACDVLGQPLWSNPQLVVPPSGFGCVLRGPNCVPRLGFLGTRPDAGSAKVSKDPWIHFHLQASVWLNHWKKPLAVLLKGLKLHRVEQEGFLLVGLLLPHPQGDTEWRRMLYPRKIASVIWGMSDTRTLVADPSAFSPEPPIQDYPHVSSPSFLPLP